MKLLIHAFIKYMAGLMMMGLILFLPAGTLQYPNGWLFCGLLFVPMLVLDSWIAFAVFLVYPALMVKRIRSEEALLEAELPGYTDYQEKVRYRMIPFLW